MKVFLILVLIGSLVYLSLPLSSISVQENIVDERGTYSWEQWCWHQHRLGLVRKERIGRFSVEATGNHNRLVTNVCD